MRQISQLPGKFGLVRLAKTFVGKITATGQADGVQQVVPTCLARVPPMAAPD
jgi:hypothetical protein